MNTLIKIGIILFTLGTVLAFFLAATANGQIETCPYGYYLASNNLCYQYPQLQQQPPPAITGQDIQNCKIVSDMIKVDKTMGVNSSILASAEQLYNDTCGTFMK
jgi:hypothetical protein